MAKYTKPTIVSNSRRHPDKEQHAVVYDILSEGPIEGLANGFASIFINDVPFIDNIANEIMKPRRVILSTTAGSANITHSQFGEINSLTLNNKSGLDLGSRTVTIVGAEKQGTGIASMTAGSDTVTTSSSFFTSDMVNSRSVTPEAFIRIAGAGQDGTDLITKVKTFVSATEITVQDVAAVTVSSKNISLDFNASISSISGNVATLSKAVPVTTSNVSCQISALNTIVGQNDDIMNFDKVKMQFKSGERNQDYIPHETGFGSAATNTALNISLEQSDLRARVGTGGNLVSGYNNELDEPTKSEGTAEDTIITSALAGVSNPSEIDEIHLTFKLPACHAIKSSGSKESSFVELQIFFEYSVDDGSSYISELLYGPTNSQIINRSTGRGGRNVNFITTSSFPNTGYIKPNEPQYNEFSEEFMIITDKFQPYDDWRIRVRRINDTNFIDGSYRHTNPCTLSTIESIIKDKLKYPYTSYISTSFNAADFEGQLPQRAYLLKGLKIQVPTNYLTRDETGGAAAYTRNITTGAIESTYQNWDGNFRGDITTFDATSVNYEKVYCNNPVWVFYDLLTNERYGLGQFIDKSNIDKYGLFQLAKYCDELVPDGEGGYEPRFTTNVYLSKAAEATNVLKQFASVFRGMAIWKDGQVTAISDREKEPVYAFTKGNIEGGIFQYEGTGNRVRTNQVKVQWNDPNDNYRQSTEYVEDQQGILETGRIVRSEHLAFGCTSRGQAHRAGKWKLLSERLEKETVSFVTSIAAVGLGPGDIITVQDADRDRSSYSGRVSATGTKTTTVIPLDRTINLPSYSSDFPPQLLLVYPKGGAYLEQETATISSVVYNRGDLIPNITSESDAANLTDDSNDSVQVFWSENVRIETKTVTTSAGNVSSLTVSSAFSEAPEEETIWSLRLFNSDGTEKTGTVKEYKVISIKEEDNYKYSIVAAEFAANKFAQIERGFELNIRPVDNSPNPEDVVPAPDSISLSVEPMSISDGSISTNTAADSQGHQLIVNWKFPENSNGTRYKFASGFEISHNIRGEARTIKTNITTQTLTFKNIKAGIYKIKVRTVSSSGTVSQYTVRQIEIAESSLGNSFTSKVDLLPKGGSINQTVTINDSTGLLEIGSSTYQFDSPSGETFLNSSATASTYQQSFSGMGASAEAYLLFDQSDSTDRFKAVQIHSDTSITPTVTYFKEVGASNNGLTAASGTIAVSANDNAIIGTSTSFESDFNNGDLVRIINGSSTTSTSSGSISDSTALTIGSSNSNIKIGHKVTGTGISSSVFVTAISGTSITLSSPQTIGNGVTLTFSPVTYYGRIQFIESDTLMYVDEVVKTTYSGATIQFQTFKPSILQDAILSKITTDGSTTYSIAEQYAVTKGITGADGSAGAAVNLAFIRKATTPGVSGNGSLPSGETNPAWTDDVPTGTDPLWAVKGNKAQGGTTWSWGTPYRVDGTAVAEIYYYSDATTGSAPSFSAPTYNFSTNSYTAPTNWNKEPPSLTANNQKVYVIVVLYASTPGDTAAAADSVSSAVIYAQKTDGLNNATVYLYKTTNSATESTLPSGNATFTFNNGTLGSFATNANGWSQTITSVSASNQYLWTTSAVASSTDSTVVIADSAWATPKLLSTFGENGLTGASVNIVFRRDSSTPSTPADSAGVPSGWSDSPPSGTDILFAVKGTKAVGGSNFTWGTVYQVEGTAAAEVAIYRKNNNATPSGGSYNFTTSTLTAPSGWSTSVPSLTANGDIVYLAVGLFSGSPEETAATTTWSTPVVYAQRTDGQDGDPGDPGQDGDNGLRTIQGYLFYEKTTSGAPSAPSGNTYTFSTGVVTGTGISTATNQPTNVWLNSPNTQDATSTNTFYTVRYYGTESAANSSTITVAYTNVVQQTSFTGVVTFSGGTLTDGTSSVDAIEAGDVAGNIGGVGVTTIDGGNIDTGTITADRIKLSGTGALVISSLNNDSNFIDSAGAPVQSVAGLTGTVTTANLSAQGLRLTSDSVSTTLLTGTVPVDKGGTGRTTTASYVADLSAAGLRLTSDLVGVAQGGTGRTSTASYVADLNAAGLRLTSDVVGEAQGGTGTTSFASALTAQGVGFVSGSNANLGALATLDNIDLSKVTDSGTLAGLNAAILGTHTTGTLPEGQGGTGQTSDAAYASHLSSQGLIVTEVAGNTGAVSAATIISAGNILVADSNVTRDTNGGITSINGGVINTGTINSSVINTNTLAVKFFANESTKIYNHESPSVAVPLLRYGFNLRGTGGNTQYTGSNASFVPVTITQVRNNASYSVILAAVLGDVTGGKVQYSLNNSTWITASGGESNIYWSAGTYRGYTYTYQGTITNMTSSQNTVYWRVYFSGSYNHTHMQLHVTMDNTT